MVPRTALLALFPALLSATVAVAGGLMDDYHARTNWPEPFMTQDRAAAQDPFCAMVAKGWEQQNMLIDQHFEEGNGRLSESGRLKVRWIVLQAPAQHRVIYVHQAMDAPATAQRVDTVQRMVMQTVPEAAGIPIVVTTLDPMENSADRIDRVNRKFLEMAPPPILPKMGGGGTGSGGGGGGSSGSTGGAGGGGGGAP
jgi:uncharacterized membrane protein YgcG